MAIFNAVQQELGHRLEEDINVSSWKDWKWQVKHRIRSLQQLEDFLDLDLGEEKRRQIQQTVEKFPLSITPN